MQHRGGFTATAFALFSAVAAAAANEQGRVGLLFPSQWRPDKVVASVVHAEPTAITYALDCPPSASDDCSILMPTMTQGPQTWAYRGEWEDIMGVDEYTMNNDCDVRTKNDKMVCTIGVTQVKDGRTASTEMVSTTTGLEDYVHPIPITAGIGKLKDDIPKPKPTQSSQISTSTSSSATITTGTEGPTRTTLVVPTVLPTEVNLAAADAPKDAAAEESTIDIDDGGNDGSDLVEATPSVVPTAAGSVSKAHAHVVALAALALGMLVL